MTTLYVCTLLLMMKLKYESVHKEKIKGVDYYCKTYKRNSSVFHPVEKFVGKQLTAIVDLATASLA